MSCYVACAVIMGQFHFDVYVDFDGLVMHLWTYYYICDIYCDGCDMCGWMCGWMRYICDI